MANQPPSTDTQLVRPLSSEESRNLVEILIPPATSADLPVGQVLIEHLACEAGGAHADRQSFLVRLLPFLVIWGMLAAGVIWKFDPSRPLVFLGFALLTAATFFFLLRQDYAHSPGGMMKDVLRESGKAGKRQDQLRQTMLKTMKDK